MPNADPHLLRAASSTGSDEVHENTEDFIKKNLHASMQGHATREDNSGVTKAQASKSLSEMGGEGAGASRSVLGAWQGTASAVIGSNAGAYLDALCSKDALLSIMTSTKSDAEKKVSLLVACDNGALQTVAVLIAQGMDVNSARGLNGALPLHMACSNGHLAVVDCLIRYGKADLEAQTDDRETPLHLAAYKGHLSVVELLLDNGSKVNASDRYGDTPLFYAARRSFPAVVRLLLKFGADANAKNSFNETCIVECTDAATKDAVESASRGGVALQASTGGTGLGEQHSLAVFHFLDARSVCRAACVSSRWHRAAEDRGLWADLGVSRWQMAVTQKLNTVSCGFAMAPFMQSFRPKSRPPRKQRKASAASALK